MNLMSGTSYNVSINVCNIVTIIFTGHLYYNNIMLIKLNFLNLFNTLLIELLPFPI